MNAADASAAIAALRGCQAALRAAYADAHTAAPHLAGVRASRCTEAADKIADIIGHVDRLLFVCSADRQSELHQLRSEAGL